MRRQGAKAERWALVGLAAALCFFAFAPSAAAAAETKPERIVSLNLCTDQLLLALVEPERIAALSFLSTDPDLSFYAREAAGFVRIGATAEEVVTLKPDLVLAEEHSARIAVSLLRELGYPVLDLPVADSLDAVREQIRVLARSLGEEARGEALVARMDAEFRALSAGLSEARPRVVVYQANGFTPGAPSLTDDLLTLAGFRNLARDLALSRSGRLSLEGLLAADPDLLVIEDAREGSASLADGLLDHPVLAARFPAERTVRIAARLWTCGGPFSVEAVRILAAAHSRAAAEAAP